MLLCDKADVSPSYLEPSELHEFVRLYRRVSTDLALARGRSVNAELIEFLNRLLARAYGLLYRRPKRSLRGALTAIPQVAAQTFRANAWFLIASAAVFLGGGALSYLILSVLPEAQAQLITGEWQTVFEHWKHGEFDPTELDRGMGMTGYYLSNNPLAAMSAASVGAASFGLLTFFSLLMNGSLLGALTYEMATVGRVGYLYLSILPHGIPELTGLVVAGGSGFRLGWALIHPGRYTRGQSLREAGRDALILLMIAFTLMLIAAPIEGFFSFNAIVPASVKGGFIVITAVLWTLFWGFYGRPKPEPVASASKARA